MADMFDKINNFFDKSIVSVNLSIWWLKLAYAFKWFLAMWFNLCAIMLLKLNI